MRLYLCSDAASHGLVSEIWGTRQALADDKAWVLRLASCLNSDRVDLFIIIVHGLCCFRIVLVLNIDAQKFFCSCDGL